MKLRRLPISTYRIQFSLGFRFVDARDLIPYLHELGITDLYASPRFRARRGSSHGYDVADPFRVNSELGTEREFAELVERLKRYRMGLLLDIVPNHMAASSDNPWWLDVMESGPASAYASFFDIDWHPPITKAAFLQENRVLLPILGDLFGRVLENGDLTLKLDESGFYLRYYDNRLPLDPKTYNAILEDTLQSLSAASGTSRAAGEELARLIARLNQLPERNSGDPQEVQKRQRDIGPLKQELWRLCQEHPGLKSDLGKTLHIFNGTRGDRKSFDRLEQLLAGQVYRLGFWKLAAEEINYRRFFDVSDLVGLRVEDPRVFAARHGQIFQLILEDKVTGLRVDHIDGLHDPREYLQRLQSAAGGGKEGGRNFFVIAEKILSHDEVLPKAWPVCGTTGYDFLNLLNGIFIDPAGLRSLKELFRRWTGMSDDFHEISYRSKKKVAEELFAGEFNVLAHLLGNLAARDRLARDVPLSELRQALIEVTACLPVYRTYLRDLKVSQPDRRYIEQALDEAARRTSPVSAGPPAFEFLRHALLLDHLPQGEAEQESRLQFVMRWQQFTGAVMAKGVEDTALYVYNPLVSMNEVAGNPGGPGTSLPEFHHALQFRQKNLPCTLNSTSTHDTKRSEDVRARINVLSEFPSAWGTRVQRWHKWNQVHKQTVQGALAPDARDELLLYQTLIGVWPLREEDPGALERRLQDYMIKAVREAKTHTNWLYPQAAYENAVTDFVSALLRRQPENRFRKDLRRFQKVVAPFGALNSLSQVLVKTTSPGIPDFYQGTELWNFSLVDPDNRRPVDFKLQLEVLEDLRRKAAQDPARAAAEALQDWRSGHVKLLVADRVLDFRKANADLFVKGEYLPLEIRGSRKLHVCAFARRLGRRWCLVAIPRLVTRFTAPGDFPLGRDAWKGTGLILPKSAPRHWTNIFTEENPLATPRSKSLFLALQSVLKIFPIALLHGISE